MAWRMIASSRILVRRVAEMAAKISLQMSLTKHVMKGLQRHLGEVARDGRVRSENDVLGESSLGAAIGAWDNAMLPWRRASPVLRPALDATARCGGQADTVRMCRVLNVSPLPVKPSQERNSTRRSGKRCCRPWPRYETILLERRCPALCTEH